MTQDTNSSMAKTRMENTAGTYSVDAIVKGQEKIVPSKNLLCGYLMYNVK